MKSIVIANTPIDETVATAALERIGYLHPIFMKTNNHAGRILQLARNDGDCEVLVVFADRLHEKAILPVRGSAEILQDCKGPALWDDTNGFWMRPHNKSASVWSLGSWVYFPANSGGEPLRAWAELLNHAAIVGRKT